MRLQFSDGLTKLVILVAASGTGSLCQEHDTARTRAYGRRVTV